MKFLLVIVLSASYLTLGPVIAVETARSLQGGWTQPALSTASDLANISIHYKTGEGGGASAS